ncbi:hypothetical protein UFOVP116_244 [uncultured Caudovirales phage]|uniref:Uncharacterized protein n=1 Tax=uncultured Caudovirales phage TaxID=2100421 RepID=A0A6J5LEI0_9CAUD|nr:hypothetical protein UFOVP116_244 [uncultured Caudovirales phage]
MDQKKTLSLALKALVEYDKFGYIKEYKPVIKAILQSLSEHDSYAETILDPELLEYSSMIMVRTIERAKKES